MKLKISFTLNLTKEEESICLEHAKSHGYSFDKANPRKILKRYFEDNGRSGIEYAWENSQTEINE